MSMYAYVGLPRSGKSYNVVANVIVPALREGRKVVTNVPVYIDKIREKLEKEKPGIEVGELVVFPVAEVAQDPELIAKYVTPGCVFVLDEVWRLWPAGEKANKIPEVYKSIIAEHGHRVDLNGNAIHIVLVVQDLGNIGMFARRLVEQTFVHTKLGHVGTPNRFRVDIYHGNVTGTTGPKERRVREMFGKYEKDVWELYKSHTLSEAKADGANEKGIDKRGNALKQPMFVIVIPAMLCAALFAGYKLYSDVNGQTRKPVVASAAPGSSAPSRPGAPSGGGGYVRPMTTLDHVVAPPAPPAYRLVGWLESADGGRKAFGVLQLVGAGKSPLVRRGAEHCRVVDTDFRECEIGGHYYGVDGETRYKGGNDEGVPVELLGQAPAVSTTSPRALPVASVASDPEDAPALVENPDTHIVGYSPPPLLVDSRPLPESRRVPGRAAR
jgi:zona occludens toxin